MNAKRKMGSCGVKMYVNDETLLSICVVYVYALVILTLFLQHSRCTIASLKPSFLAGQKPAPDMMPVNTKV